MLFIKPVAIIQRMPAHILLLMLFAACNTNSNKVAEKSTSTQATDVTPVKDSALNYKIDTSRQVNKLLVRRDTLLTVNMQNNKGTVRAYLSGIGRHVTILVPVINGDSLTAVVIPDDSIANIRFNQIYVPKGKNGKYDGPFSRNISYPVTVKGTYKLIVGEDLMAEGDWKGNFTCNVAIKNKKAK